MRTTALILLYVATATLGIYQMFRPTINSGFESIQTERGDGMLNHYILENSWQSISNPDYCGTLITPPFCHPERGTIYYSETLFGTTPVYWVLRLVLPVDLAYISWQMVFAALNFVAFVVVGRWWNLSHVITIGCAYLWAFGMVHVDQIMHQQMIPRLWMPFAVYYATRLVTEPSPKSLNRLMGCTFMQCFSCFYTGWFLAMGLAVFLPTMMLLNPSSFGGLWRLVRDHSLKVLGISAVWALAMAALFGPYFVFNPSQGHDYQKDILNGNLLPKPESWITGPKGSCWHDTLAETGYSQTGAGECRVFCGFGVFVLMGLSLVGLVGVRRSENPALWSFIIAGLFTAAVWWAFTVSTSEGDSLWKWVRHLPGGRAIRVVGRIEVTVYLFGTTAALVWLDMITKRIPVAWIRILLVSLIVAGLIWEQTGVQTASFKRADFYTLVDRAAEDMKGAEVGYTYPHYTDTSGGSSASVWGEVFGMWVGLRANVPVINGYSGVLPEGFENARDLTDDEIRQWLRGKYHGKVRVIDQTKPGQYREVTVD